MPETVDSGPGLLPGFRDREDFDRFYDTYLPRVYGFALRRLGSADAAQEVTRSVFLQVLEAKPTAATGSLDEWLLAATRRALEERAGE